MYSDKSSKEINSDFKFGLRPGTAAAFMTSRKLADIVFTFSEPATETGFKSFDEVFAIEGIYETQKDVAEELILKAETYNDSYKKQLKDTFPAIFNDTSLSNRLIIGNYGLESEIHKRPMAKFTQDIAKQLKLIPKDDQPQKLATPTP